MSSLRSDRVDRNKQSLLSAIECKYAPPWKVPYVIAIAGSSGSGKTSVAQTIINRLNVSILCLVF